MRNVKAATVRRVLHYTLRIEHYTDVRGLFSGIREKSAPPLPWAPSTLNPTSIGGHPPRRFVRPSTSLGMQSPTGDEFPVTWCWLTLTGTSRTAQGSQQPTPRKKKVQVFSRLEPSHSYGACSRDTGRRACDRGGHPAEWRGRRRECRTPQVCGPPRHPRPLLTGGG